MRRTTTLAEVLLNQVSTSWDEASDVMLLSSALVNATEFKRRTGAL